MHSGTRLAHVHHGNLTPGPTPTVVASTRDRRGAPRIPDLSDGGPHPASDGRALCREEVGYDPTLWFPDSQTTGAAEPAKAICAICPVQAACLAYARASRSRTRVYGVWGGVWFTDERGEEA